MCLPPCSSPYRASLFWDSSRPLAPPPPPFLPSPPRPRFALLNGDSILLVYQELCTVDDAWYCVFSQIYLYTFCIIFIVVVLNVFIFIIETGYEKAQMATTPHDEHPVILDHNRLRRILDAADRAAGIDLRQLGADGKAFGEGGGGGGHMPMRQ